SGAPTAAPPGARARSSGTPCFRTSSRRELRARRRRAEHFLLLPRSLLVIEFTVFLVCLRGCGLWFCPL
uniref:Uncharacterized protein n=1 Tax=Aegilops tauschii subsp. strangulata TaxID=200361 RepID=A0A453T657_AEGTS